MCSFSFGATVEPKNSFKVGSNLSFVSKIFNSFSPILKVHWCISAVFEEDKCTWKPVILHRHCHCAFDCRFWPSTGRFDHKTESRNSIFLTSHLWPCVQLTTVHMIWLTYKQRLEYGANNYMVKCYALRALFCLKIRCLIWPRFRLPKIDFNI